MIFEDRKKSDQKSSQLIKNYIKLNYYFVCNLSYTFSLSQKNIKF
jgi:hypothetical protein